MHTGVRHTSRQDRSPDDAMRQARRHPASLALLALFASLLHSCASFDQTPETALVREPGERAYGAPVPIAQEAKKHWEFALLSQSAYAQLTKDKQGSPAPAVGRAVAAPPSGAATGADVMGDCHSSAKTLLLKAGWTRWSDFADPALAEEIRNAHLRVEVWERRDPAAVVLSFGGTLFASGDDWLANLRWLLPWRADPYTTVLERLGATFVRSYAERLADPASQHLKDATLHATGYALGGALAQRFALALPQGPGVPPVQSAVAFDPSLPIDRHRIDASRRDAHERDLAVDLVFEHGEALTELYSMINFVYPPPAAHPAVRSVRYQLFYALNPIAGHAMGKLACRLYEASDHSIED